MRKGAPEARLIVDANEMWGQLGILAEAEALADFGVEMIEQPVGVGAPGGFRRHSQPARRKRQNNRPAEVAIAPSAIG